MPVAKKLNGEYLARFDSALKTNDVCAVKMFKIKISDGPMCDYIHATHKYRQSGPIENSVSNLLAGSKISKQQLV